MKIYAIYAQMENEPRFFVWAEDIEELKKIMTERTERGEFFGMLPGWSPVEISEEEFDVMKKKCLENMTIEKFCEYHHPPLTSYEKEIYDKICNKGWLDVAQAYFDSCKNRNYAEFVVSLQPRGIYKNDEHMTKEQTKKWNKLIKMGWRDVAKAYGEVCDKENYTESFKMRLKYRWVDSGVEMGLDEED